MSLLFTEENEKASWLCVKAVQLFLVGLDPVLSDLEETAGRNSQWWRNVLQHHSKQGGREKNKETSR